MRNTWFSLLILAALLPAWGRQTSDPAMRLLQDATVKAALDSAKANEASTIEDQIRLSEIPAPSFGEGTRADAVQRIFTELGLRNVRIDKAGNVIGERPGVAPRPNVVLAAHLDTVFPEGTNVKVSREGSVLKGPGIGDDARGLAVIIGVAKALHRGKVQTPGTITLVADVGEEGLGDLRGMKQLFNETLRGQVDFFVSVDGSGLDVTNVGVGSYRYRITYQGPGGHSYGAFGLPNPIHALGRAIAIISDFQVPSTTKTTFNVGRIGGGTSINSIPYEAWMEMDMRSADVSALKVVESEFMVALADALEHENARWGGKVNLTVDTKKVGDRPAGKTQENSAIVQTALSVTRALGAAAQLGDGSTDANYPMSLKIPAIAIGGGGRGTGGHSLAETFDMTGSWLGTQRALLLAIALAR